MAPEFVVGIDLGTTNSLAASCELARGADAPVEVFPLQQHVAPGEAAALEHLPSALYLPASGEFASGATRLPWGDDPGAFVGAFAVKHGAKVPGRLVTSAKSWLSYAGVDRTAAILPWGASPGVVKLSPVEASTRLLAHVRAAWDAAHPKAPLAEQDVVLTVPASFDEVARELTVQAARAAGLPRFGLLEEPQAAFYDFLHAHRRQLRTATGDARLVLVVDVGGGTTDLTLVAVRAQEHGPPRLERIAVGEHLMLGGDNMDAALARHVEEKLTGKSGSLDAAQWGSLVHACRLAKEALLAERPPEEYGVALVGRGSKLLGGAQTHTLKRADAEELLLDGFLPRSGPEEVAQRRGRLALTELSLPFASDPAIPRHICGFLRRHVEVAADTGVPVYEGLPRPDAILLNGGVFNGPAVVARLGEVLAGWFGGARIPLLAHTSLDLAVARGAAYYGLVRRGHGIRIGGGSAHAYWIGVEGEGGARQALCVAPRGMEEGASHELDRTFRLVLGKPVSFPIYMSEKGGGLGEVAAVGGDLEALPPVDTVLKAEPEVPVRLRARLTEVGTLEIALHATPEALQEWRLSFATRAWNEQEDEQKVQQQLPKVFPGAEELVKTLFGAAAKETDAKEVRGLMKALERILGPRESWSTTISRELFRPLILGVQRRRKSADHERVFFQLAGYLLRPGFGSPLDDWRADELWKVFAGGVQYVTHKPNWAAWWVMWRRVAGGLDAGRQRQLFDSVRPWLDPTPKKPAAGPEAFAHDEMVRLVAALERLSAEHKQEAARWVLHRLERGEFTSWWPLGRIGARQPFAGSAHDVVPRGTAEKWIARLLALDWTQADGAALAAGLIARVTGDRERDLTEPVRTQVAARLDAASKPEWARAVREVVDLSAQDETQVFGETLPAGLKLH